MLSFSSLISALMIFLTAFTQCADQPQPIENDPSAEVADGFVVDTLTSALRNPWGMAWLPDGRMLITERAGEIRIIENGILSETRISGLPEVYARGQGGLMDIKLHPDYDQNGWIYISYSSPNPNGQGGNTAIMRGRIRGNEWVDAEKLYQAEPYTTASVHFGSRIVFDDQGFIFFTIGDRGAMQNAQDLSFPTGKVHRLHDDGRVPADNPFVNQTGAIPSIWSYGHRNPQGLVRDSNTGKIWAHEHGPRGGDELNLVKKGLNYGWPVISYGINYDGTILTELTAKEGMEQPVHQWTPSIAPCGMAIYTGDAFPQWKGNLFVGALAFRYVARVKIEGDKFVEEEKLLDKVARVRAVEQGPDGFLYVATEGPGMIMRLRSN